MEREIQDNLNLLALKYTIGMLQSQTEQKGMQFEIKEFLKLWSGSLACKAENFTYLENWIVNLWMLKFLDNLTECLECGFLWTMTWAGARVPS